MNEEDFLKLLRENKAYKAALASVNDEEAEKISSYVEGIVTNMASRFMLVAKKIRTDEEFKKEFSKAVSDVDSVVISEKDVSKD